MPRFLPLQLLAALLLPTPLVHAQHYPPWVYGPPPPPRRPPQPFDPADHSPVSFAGYLGLGLQDRGIDQTEPATMSVIGIYAELNYNHLHPGLDLRGVSSSNENAGGTLVGPRFSYSANIFHPYVEALFGPNHVVSSTTDRQGITSELVVGLEAACSQHIRWRVLEYTHGSFSGLPNSHPDAFFTALVLHFP